MKVNLFASALTYAKVLALIFPRLIWALLTESYLRLFARSRWRQISAEDLERHRGHWGDRTLPAQRRPRPD